MLYEFELGHNTMEATKNICCAKDEDAVNHSTVIIWLRSFAQVSRISMTWQGEVDLQMGIPILCSKPLRHI